MDPGEHSCLTEMKASTSYGRWNFLVICMMWSFQKKVNCHHPTQKKRASAFAKLVQCLDDRSLSLVIREANNDGRKALKVLREHYQGKGKPISLPCRLSSVRFTLVKAKPPQILSWGRRQLQTPHCLVPSPGWERVRVVRWPSKSPRNKTHATETPTRRNPDDQVLGELLEVAVDVPRMTIRDQSREDVSGPTSSLATPKHALRVGAWNVRTMYETGKTARCSRRWRDIDSISLDWVKFDGPGPGKSLLEQEQRFVIPGVQMDNIMKV